MIELQVADLVVIAARVLETETAVVLERLDVEAAEAALAAARQPPAPSAPADLSGPAAALLHALVRRGPLPAGNERLALLATAQFLALNGLQVDLEPPERTREMLAEVAGGRLEVAGLAGWLAPRVRHGVCGGDEVDQITSCANRRSPWRWLPTRRWRRGAGGDRFHRYTDRARTVVVMAQDEARRLGHNYVGTEHILLGLIAEREGVAAKALELRGIGLDAVRDQVEQIIGRGGPARAGHIPFTPRAKRVLLECSLREAMGLGHNYVGTEHLLLGLLREGQGVAAEVLVNLGAYHTTTREQVIDLLHDHLHDRPGEPSPPTPPPLPELRDLDDRIAQVRKDKRAAIDAGRDEVARGLRATEKRLLAERRERVGAWMAGTNVVALVEETRRLRSEVDRLRELLHHHGIEPGREPPPPPAAQAGR